MHTGQENYLLIAGTSFCGSTLLARLLGCHPRIATISEPQGPMGPDRDEYRCSCGERLTECSFWRTIRAEMGKRGIDFDLHDWDLLYGIGRSRWTRHLLTRSFRQSGVDRIRDRLVRLVPAWRGRLERVGVRNESFVESVLAATEKDVYLDASKDPLRARFLRATTRFRPYFLHLVRDAPGFVNSHIKNTGADAAAGVRLWNRMAGHCHRQISELPDRQALRVRYEDLCDAPQDQLDRIVRFVGLEPYPESWDPGEHEHHLVGNRMRLRPLDAIRLDDSWKRELAPDTLRFVLRKTARWRRRFGYA